MKIILLLLFLFNCAIIYFAHTNINYALFKDSLVLLTSSASILFAILGVWIALLYPKEFSNLKSGKIDESDRFKDLKTLVNSMVLCVLTICFILIANFCSIYLKKYATADNLNIFQYISSLFLSIITITQIYCYLTILLPTTSVDTQVKTNEHKQKIMDKFSPEED